MKFKNFKIWRGKLPHWRADDVRYYVTFRHRRPLQDWERLILFRQLIKPDGRKWDLLIVCVLPETTELIFMVRKKPTGAAIELSEIVEPAKRKAGQQIVKKTGERWPPFFEESFDRIIRDDVELEERWDAIFQSPANAELADPDEWDTLWVQDHGQA